MTGLLTLGNGQPWESDLVAALDVSGSGFTVVRRCADVSDLLATAATGRAAVAVVDGNARRLDGEAVQRLRQTGVSLVAVHPTGDIRVGKRLEFLGVPEVLADTTPVAELVAAAQRCVADPPDATVPAGAPADLRQAFTAGRPVDHGRPPARPAPAPGADPVRGRVVAVWGPTGAPGRTTVALGLADSASALGVSTLLVDADVYGGVLASALGLLDESPGLAGACRLAVNGRLDGAELARLCWQVRPGLKLMTGIARADRWPEVRPSAIPVLLSGVREANALTVLDCGFSVETDEELSYDTLAPRRNGATLAFLDAADVVLVVGSADPPGMERLVRAINELAEVLPGVKAKVVLNRVRRGVARGGEAAAALRRFTGLDPIASIPEDRAGTDAAWARAAPLSVAAPSSPMAGVLAGLARSVLPAHLVAAAAGGGPGGRRSAARVPP